MIEGNNPAARRSCYRSSPGCVVPMRTFAAAVVLLLLPLITFASGMKVTVGDDLSYVDVEVESGLGRLEAHSDELWQGLTILKNGTKKTRFLVPDDPDYPVVYRVALTHTSTQWGISRWHSHLRLSDWTHWLLVPEGWSMKKPFDLEINVPDNGLAILPFQLISHEPGRGIYKAHPILPDHGGLSVFGDVQLKQLAFGKNKITAAVVGEHNSRSSQWFEWVSDVAKVAVDVHGYAPGEHALVVIIPVPFVSGVVPWAHVRRGGGSHVIAYVKEDAETEALYEDWTLFHEMTHLYHPYLHSGGRWVSEGFASYYQNVYRASAGVVDPEHAYRRLLAGMERGRKENQDAGNRPVTQGGRMRTYWTGAAMALEADIQLQKDGRSLGEAIGRFASRQMPVDRAWHPRDYLAALDRELDEDILVPLYDDYVRDRYFPELEAAPNAWESIFSGD